MGKLLKVLVVFIFLFSIAALVLGILNFNKREMLIGRAHTLEERIIKLAASFEAKDPVFDGVADHPAKDVDAVTDRIIDVPTTSPFWDDYKNELEVTGTTLMDISGTRDRVQLRQFFFLDSEGKKEINPVTGAPRTDGTGTMTELLERVQSRANAQYATLNRVRAELTKVREELSTTIRELNAEKRARRENLRKITELEATVAKLEAEKVELNRKINQLEREKAELSDEIVELKTEITTKDEQIEQQKDQLAKIKKQLDDLLTGPTATGRDPAPVEVRNMASGTKGRVVSADPNWAFVIVELTPEAVTELLGPEGDQQMPAVEFMVQRRGADAEKGEFVTRLRLKSIKRDGSNLALADNLQNWEQTPVAANDEVFY